MNLLQVMHVLVQNSLTSFSAFPRSDRLQLLAGLELPIATPSFLSHLCDSFGQVILNLLQLRFCVITEGNISIQPEYEKRVLK